MLQHTLFNQLTTCHKCALGTGTAELVWLFYKLNNLGFKLQQGQDSTAPSQHGQGQLYSLLSIYVQGCW